MDASGFGDCHFVGDLDDPWVAEMAAALPPEVGRLHVAGGLPRPWPEAIVHASAVIVHRSWLTNSDAERVLALRSRSPRPPRVLLMTGLMPRYHQMERWVPLVDRLVPETLPPELLVRWLCPGRPAWSVETAPRGPRPTLAVVSRIHELRQVLCEILRRGGFSVVTGREWVDVPAGLTALWDVPLLDDDWQDELAREAETRRVLVLAPFLDRALVARLTQAGAQAWLDLPCDLDDLFWLIERVTARGPTRSHSPHVQPAGYHAGLSAPSIPPRQVAPMAADSPRSYNATS
jgi:hypothetical protein